MTCWLCGSGTTRLGTDAEVISCKDSPCQICIAVAEVDGEINQTVATLRRLLAKRCNLRSEQNRVHGTLINRLPVELKYYIFELLLPLRDEWGTLPGIGDRTIMPSYLTSICRSWRDIALSSPSLWSTMHIALGTHNSKSDPCSRINFVHDWILRSRPLPLTLHVVVHDKGFPEEELKGVIDATSQCSNRWHSLSLDMPLNLLEDFHHSNFQCHSLKRLRIIARDGYLNQPLPFLNPKTSLEEIEIYDVSFWSLRISWNHLSSAKVESFYMEEIAQLFQHASQMTYCHISLPNFSAGNFSMPSIIHQRLKTFSLCSARYLDMGATLLGSLTLPRLEEFRTDEIVLLTPTCLSALVHRSSCPLTRITISIPSGAEFGPLDDLQPLPGVTDVVLEYLGAGLFTIEKLLLEEYFPDLRHLTLRLQPFFCLWHNGIISMLLDRKKPHPDAGNEGRHRKLLVIDRHRIGEFNALVWKSGIGRELEALELNITLREDGFEVLIPEA